MPAKKAPPKQQAPSKDMHQISIDAAKRLEEMFGGSPRVVGGKRVGGATRKGGGASSASSSSAGGRAAGLEAMLASLMGGGGLGSMPMGAAGIRGGGPSASYFDASRSDEIPSDNGLVFAPKSACDCKRSSRFGSCPHHEIPFADCHSFPRFRDLPNCHAPFGRYFNEGSGMLLPTRPWFFMGELMSNAIPFLRSRCPLATRHGDREVPIMFYPEDDSDTQYLSTQQPKMKKGNTVVLSSPMWKTFMDGQQGIREEGSSYYVLAAPLKTVTRYGRLLLHNADAASDVVKREEEAVCVTCAKTASEAVGGPTGGDDGSPRKLSRCAQCKVAQYCSVDCQKKDWACHKGLCADSQRILALASAHRAKSNQQSMYTCDRYEPPVNARRRFNILSYPSSSSSSPPSTATAATSAPSAGGAKKEAKRQQQSVLLTREQLLDGKLEALAYGKSPYKTRGDDHYNYDEDDEDYSDEYDEGEYMDEEEDYDDFETEAKGNEKEKKVLRGKEQKETAATQQTEEPDVDDEGEDICPG